MFSPCLFYQTDGQFGNTSELVAYRIVHYQIKKMSSSVDSHYYQEILDAFVRGWKRASDEAKERNLLGVERTGDNIVAHCLIATGIAV